MSDETDRSADEPEEDEAKARELRSEPLDTDNVAESVVQGPPPNPAAEVDPDAPGLSALGKQSGPPVEPNEPA